MTEFNWPLMKNSISFMDRIKLANFVLTSNKFTQGKLVDKFESEWSNWLGSKHSLFVSSGSTANFLLVSAIIEKYKLKKGDKVLLPACTWVTNINPIIQLGLQPIFCDINLQDYSFDLIDMQHISQVHPDIKMIFVTHLLGIPAKNHEYEKLFPNSIIIDDVCESHGCTNNYEKVGSNSIGATFSFYFGHHMTTIEGGMISTNDDELYDLMKMKRSHGLARASIHFEEYAKEYFDVEKSFLFVTDGYNFRNTEIGALIGIQQLKRLDKYIIRRRENYDFFFDFMNGKKSFYPLTYQKENSCFCFPFICKTKKIKQKLITVFNKNKIEYRPIVGGNLLRQPYLNQYHCLSIKNGLNVNVLHTNGIYIGNNQYVKHRDMMKLENILGEFE